MDGNVTLGQIVAAVVLGTTVALVYYVVVGVAFLFALLVACVSFEERRRVRRLGGVTTLERTLSDNCVVCRDRMEAGEEVRTLSCNHVFHCGGSEKCGDGIDEWLAEKMICPICQRTPHPVPPPSPEPAAAAAPAPSASAEEPAPQQSSSGSERTPPPRSSSGLESRSHHCRQRSRHT